MKIWSKRSVASCWRRLVDNSSKRRERVHEEKSDKGDEYENNEREETAHKHSIRVTIYRCRGEKEGKMKRLIDRQDRKSHDNRGWC